MATRNVKIKGDFFAKYGNGPEIKSALTELAEKAKGIAEEYAETFRSERDHEHYADSFEVGLTERYVGEETIPRAVAQLTNTAPHAAAVEWGYKGRADAEGGSPHRVFGQTLAALETHD